jgi:intracellular septation protein
MKFFLDLLPVIFFFITYKWSGGSNAEAISALMTQLLGSIVQGGVIGEKEAPILAATAVTVLLTLVLVVIAKIRGEKVDTAQWVSLGVVVLLGGATLFFHDESFIKLKPTALYAVLAFSLLFGHFVLKKNGIQALMGSQIKVPQFVWTALLWAWVCFFAVMGVLNLLVANHFDTDTWVNFKMFGTLGATIVFVIIQSLAISKYIQPDTAPPTDSKP